jgi:hypothetical protein
MRPIFALPLALVAVAMTAGLASTAQAERNAISMHGKQTSNGLWVSLSGEVKPGASPAAASLGALAGQPVTQQVFSQFGAGSLPNHQGWQLLVSKVMTATTNNGEIIFRLENAPPASLHTRCCGVPDVPVVHGVRAATMTLSVRQGQCSASVIVSRHADPVTCQQPPDVTVASGPLTGGTALITVFDDAGRFLRRITC